LIYTTFRGCFLLPSSADWLSYCHIFIVCCKIRVGVWNRSWGIFRNWSSLNHCLL